MEESLDEKELREMLMSFEFDVLIADGVKDSSGDIIYVHHGTKVDYPKEPIPVMLDNSKDRYIGTVTIRCFDFSFKAKFNLIKDNINLKALVHLTPSINGKVNVRDGAFLRSITIESISAGFGPNSDKRIKTIMEQFLEANPDKEECCDSSQEVRNGNTGTCCDCEDKLRKR